MTVQNPAPVPVPAPTEPDIEIVYGPAPIPVPPPPPPPVPVTGPVPQPAPPVPREPARTFDAASVTPAAELPVEVNPPVVIDSTPPGFGLVAVAGQNTATARVPMDRLTFVGTNGITITTNSATNTVTWSGTNVNIVAGDGISVETVGSNTVVTNTFTETVYTGGNVSGSLTPDRNNGTIQKFTLTGNLTLNLPVNMSAGQSLTLILTQDSAGNRLLDANVGYLFASGFQTLGTASGGIDMMNIFSDGSTYYTTLTVDYS